MKPKYVLNMQLDRIISKVRMRFDVDPTIDGDRIILDASNLSIRELHQLDRYLASLGLRLSLVNNITFNIVSDE